MNETKSNYLNDIIDGVILLSDASTIHEVDYNPERYLSVEKFSDLQETLKFEFVVTLNSTSNSTGNDIVYDSRTNSITGVIDCEFVNPQLIINVDDDFIKKLTKAVIINYDVDPGSFLHILSSRGPLLPDYLAEWCTITEHEFNFITIPKI